MVLSFQSWGMCRQCQAGDAAYCELTFPVNFGGQRLDGSHAIHGTGPDDDPEPHDQFFGQSSFATYAITTERNTVKVPSDLPLDLLAPLGCGLQTGAGAILNSLALTTGASVAIIGTGSVGLAAIMAAKAVGASTIIGIDINADRLKLAKEFGATHTVDTSTQDVAAEVKTLTGRGVDAVIDLTGRTESIEMAVGMLGPRGTVVLIASPAFDAVARIPVIVLSAGASIRGVVQGDSKPHVFIPELIEMYRQGRFPFDRLITYYDFADINAAFEDARSGGVIKPVLRIGS